MAQWLAPVARTGSFFLVEASVVYFWLGDPIPAHAISRCHVRSKLNSKERTYRQTSATYDTFFNYNRSTFALLCFVNIAEAFLSSYEGVPPRVVVRSTALEIGSSLGDETALSVKLSIRSS